MSTVIPMLITDEEAWDFWKHSGPEVISIRCYPSYGLAPKKMHSIDACVVMVAFLGF